MNALSVPSAAVPFLVKFGAISRACGKKERKRAVFPCITFCEGLIPDVESPFLGLANVEVSNNHSQGLQGSKANEEKYGVTFHAGPSSPGRV